MTNLYCNFFTLINSFIYLTHWSWGNWLGVKLLEYIFNLLTQFFFKCLFCLLIGMLRSMLPQMNKFMSHLLTYNISSMTHVLKTFNPYYACPFNGLNEAIQPKWLHKLEIAKRVENGDRKEYENKMKETKDMANNTPYCREIRFFAICNRLQFHMISSSLKFLHIFSRCALNMIIFSP